MYEFVVRAKTMETMREKLLEAAKAMKGSVKKEEPKSLPITQPDPNVYNPGAADIPAEVSPFPNQAPAPNNIPVQPMPNQPMPISPNAPASPPAQHSELDSRGLPWDERIHSASRGRNKDGSWRSRRGIDDAVITQVEVELRNQLGTRAPSPAPNVAAQPGLPAPQPYQGNVAAPVIPPPIPQPQQAPVASLHLAPPLIAPAAVTPPPVVTPPLSVSQPSPQYDNISIPQVQKSAHTLETFRQNLIPTMSQLVTEGKINQDYINTLKNYFEVNEIWEVSKDESKVTELFENFAQHGFITKVG